MNKYVEETAQRIFNRVLKEIKPSGAEVQDVTYRVNRLMRLMADIVPKDVELRVAGSIARGTNLKGDADIDIFMLFDKRYPKEKLVKLGLEYGKRATQRAKGSYEIKYAEHPYIRLYLESVGIKADIVPASRIANIEEMSTTVDRTPLHTEFINSNLSARQRDEVRLLKYMLKAHKIYGAEIKTGGFSGYLCELMIYHYGSLTKALEAASGFKLPLIIDPRFRKEITDEAMTKRFGSDFVVLDPVDKDRNVAAGVSHESLGRFVLVARQFVHKPSIDIFYRGGFSSIKVGSLLAGFLKESGLDTFLIASSIPDKSEDITFPQLRKVSRQIEDHIQKKGFTLYLSMQLIKGRKGILLFMAPEQKLVSRTLKGPDVFVAEASHKFIEKHSNSLGFYVADTTLYALEKSKYPTIDSVLRDLPRTLQVHKDINIKNASITTNKIPKDIALEVYSELLKKLTI
jgi:tRNA nucleotidyltransferase (CCA-adding enzyme)